MFGERKGRRALRSSWLRYAMKYSTWRMHAHVTRLVKACVGMLAGESGGGAARGGGEAAGEGESTHSPGHVMPEGCIPAQHAVDACEDERMPGLSRHLLGHGWGGGVR